MASTPMLISQSYINLFSQFFLHFALFYRAAIVDISDFFPPQYRAQGCNFAGGMSEKNNYPNSNSNYSAADAAVESSNNPLSTTFVNAFAAIGVDAPPPSNLPSPNKNQKKPSGCMTGTPSSAQRPSKIRISTSTPQTTVPSLASAQPVITEIDQLNLLPPPTITSQFNNQDRDRARQQLFFPESTDKNPSRTIDLALAQDEELFRKSITVQVKNRFDGFKFMIGIPVKNGAEPGYKKWYNAGELVAKETIMKNGLWAMKNNRCKPHADARKKDGCVQQECNDSLLLTDETGVGNGTLVKEQVTRGFHGKRSQGVEAIAIYSCRAAGCKCQLTIARIAGGLLAYEKIDTDTSEPYVHTGHDTLASSEKLDPYSLTHSQQVYVLNDGAILAHRKDWFALARAMIMDPFVYVSPCQASSESTFSQRIKYFVQRESTKGHGLASTGNKMMTGTQIEQILNFLQDTNRNNLPLNHTIPFLQTMDFNALWKTIRVTSHNYTASGGTFDYICAEYQDASARSKMAVDTFGDAGVQGEMDFFHVPGAGADWQVGHIGFSDLKHRYYILGMIICRSENSHSAGMLIKRVLQLINIDTIYWV